jgi:hypothetical protein
MYFLTITSQKISMQNQKIDVLLYFLKKECGLNKFSVVEKKDILSLYEKKYYIDESELENLMQSLERQGYIKIKYDDENVYCLAVLKDFEIREKKERKANSFLSFLLVFLASFLGGFFGSILTFLF